MRSTFPPLVAARRWTRIFISSISPPSAAPDADDARAAEVDAETVSGGVTIHLPPSSYGFALDFETVSGTPEIAFDANGGDGHWTYGDKASTLNIDTASGNLSLD